MTCFVFKKTKETTVFYYFPWQKKQLNPFVFLLICFRFWTKRPFLFKNVVEYCFFFFFSLFNYFHVFRVKICSTTIQIKNGRFYIIIDVAVTRARIHEDEVKLPKAERRHVEGGRQFLQPYPHPTVFFFDFLSALYSCVKRSVCRLPCMAPSWIWIADPR